MDTKKHDKWRKSFPYYKVQYWDRNVRAWHDIQKSFTTVALAQEYGEKLKRKYRIMVINRKGRKPL